MSFEEIIQLDPHTWPLAIMAFLRIVTIFFFLPLLGDAGVPRQLRIALALLFTICLWPIIVKPLHASHFLMQWSPLTLCIATLREVFFGFVVAFSARMILFASSIGAQIVGVNMGFQTATLFSHDTNQQESPLSVLQGWITTMVILALNIHHVFFEGMAKSFVQVPIGPVANPAHLLQLGVVVVSSSFILGVKLAAPLLVLQILVTVVLGCLGRTVPQLNAFVLSFPVSFLLSMTVLFLSIGMLVRYLGQQGMEHEVGIFAGSQKVFFNR